MNIFSKADSGVKDYHSFFPLKERIICDMDIGRVVPIYADLCIPGDIRHMNQEVFIRTQAMLAPLLTNLNCRLRAWFVPLRLIDENTELIITGSKNGKFDRNTVIPSFPNIFADATDFEVIKYSALDYMMSMPIGNYANTKTNNGLPAQYWLKAYERIKFDWYRDENLCPYDDFDDYWDTLKTAPGKVLPFYANWSKDYFTSALLEQQKGPAPTFDFSLVNPDDLSTFFGLSNTVIDLKTDKSLYAGGGFSTNSNKFLEAVDGTTQSPNDKLHIAGLNAQSQSPSWTNATIQAKFAGTPGIDFGGLASTLDVADLRTVTQLQRILERLNRTGSRYTEYLYSNFGVSPKDETLQRVQFLGSYKQPIVVSQVEQTAEDGSTPVGTLRGKGISLERGAFPTFHCKEWGVLYITMEVMPKAMYTQGIRKKYTIKNRFDFFNRSYQFLSEDLITNSEIYWEFDSTKVLDDGTPINNGPFGFTEMYNYLRTTMDRVAGDMRYTQSYWLMARYFSETPVLSEAFIEARDAAAFAAPFAVTSMPPLIVEFYAKHGVYRPMAKYGTPGLVDHS